MTHDCNLAIVGSGFGGSVLAMVARRLGLRVMLLERGQHPRFAIGESASPLAGILIEQLAERYALPQLTPLATHGAWRRAYPDVVCGLKRGFTYFRHEPGERYRAAGNRSNQLLVAASPNDEVSDTHWLRADVDHFLMREAAALGVEYLDRVELDRVEWQPDGTPTLWGTRAGRALRIAAQFVVDASGPRGFLSRALGIGNVGFDGYPATQALFSHFTGVARCADMPDYGFTAPAPVTLAPAPGTCTDAPSHSRTTAPYPPDDAALHHVFDGGWMWVLRFDNGVTSAGVAVTDELAADLRLADGARAWHRLLDRFPSIAAQFAEASAIREFTWMPRLAWRAERAAGPGWAMLPSAAAFIDPLFSTGIPLTLLGIERLATRLEGRPEGRPLPEYTADRPVVRRGRPSGRPLSEYSETTLGEADHTARFVAGCYAAFPDFERFTAYSMFYFAAASYSELARRVGVTSPDTRFLCADKPAFADATATLSPALGSPMTSVGYAAQVRRAIDAVNIAGLCDPDKNNWYGIDAQDALDGAGKLGVTRAAVAQALAAAGMPDALHA